MSGAVRAKFRCEEVTKKQDWRDKSKYLYDAKFSAVHSGSKENEEFWAASPAGQLSVCSSVCDQFQPGREYYLDITLAPEAPAAG